MIPINIREIENIENSTKFTYNFNSKELLALAKFLRDNQEKLSKDLDYFYQALEKSVYNSLSIDEVRNFYS